MCCKESRQHALHETGGLAHYSFCDTQPTTVNAGSSMPCCVLLACLVGWLVGFLARDAEGCLHIDCGTQWHQSNRVCTPLRQPLLSPSNSSMACGGDNSGGRGEVHKWVVARQPVVSWPPDSLTLSLSPSHCSLPTLSSVSLPYVAWCCCCWHAVRDQVGLLFSQWCARLSRVCSLKMPQWCAGRRHQE